MRRQPFRIPEGGLDIDRERTIRFDFDGIRYEGYAGDTVASALLANGVRIVARSFKYHRPRGIVAIGSEEPNALIRVGQGAEAEPNRRATEVLLRDGLVTESQNRWPSPGFDLGGVATPLARFLAAGFYNKTFMGPPWGWRVWEPYIRRMAGLGRIPEGPDPDPYAKQHVHCEVLVAGGGPTGLVATLAAARTGVRVILADEGEMFGGGLRLAPIEIDGKPARDWVAEIVQKLERLENVTLLPRATVTGYYDHELLTIVERAAEGVEEPDANLPRQRVWMVRSRQVVLATGAIERLQVFPGNDLPQIMLMRAMRGYLHRFGVLSGRNLVLCTNNDTAYHAAAELRRGGASIVAIVDARDPPNEEALALARSENIPVFPGHVPTFASGRGRVRRLEASRLSADGRGVSGLVERFACDAVGLSGGWTPTVHLFSQARGRLRYDPDLAAFVPGEPGGANRSAGACNGEFDLAACLWQGFEAGAAAAADAGATAVSVGAPRRIDAGEADCGAGAPIVLRPAAPRRGKPRFVDLQNDVTVEDIELAVREGYHSVEHVKRYTMLGMGTDQGKLSNMHGLAHLADVLREPIPSVGTTTFRPPYVPVTIGAMAAGKVGELGRPVRRTAVHDWHETDHATLVDDGLWKRPAFYLREGESGGDAEARAARTSAALVDLGSHSRIELQGPDARAFLDRLAANDLPELAVGRGGFVLLLREDGMVFDHGIAMRLGAERFLLATVGDPGALVEHLSFLLQAVWPELRVFVTDVSEHWFAAALLGPRSGDVLAELVEDVELPDEPLSLVEVEIGEVPARLLRTEVCGEPAYEIHIAADYAVGLWSSIMAAGANHELEACGTEAMDAIRIENGVIAIGAEADGRTTPRDLGLERLVSQGKDFIGRRSLALPALREIGRLELVGLRVEGPEGAIPPGAQLIRGNDIAAVEDPIGHVTSRSRSPILGRGIGLALLRGGRSHEGERMFAASPLTGEIVAVTVTPPRVRDAPLEPAEGEPADEDSAHD